MNRKKTQKIAALAAAVISASALHAQTQTTAAVPQNVASLSASGTVEVQQDLLTVSMSTTRDGADANAVQSQLRTALDVALKEAQKAAQTDQMEVRTGAFSLNPRYDKNGKINGWQGMAELVLEGRDFARISSTASKIQTLTIASTGFGLSRQARAKAENEAQSMAIGLYKSKAETIAKSFGFTGYTLREIQISAEDRHYGGPRMMTMAAARSLGAEQDMPLQAGRSQVVMTVSGSVQLR